jgi:L-seryl-tRNA(Ser) seleniumtransferase
MARDSLRELPAVDRLLAHARTQALLARFSRTYVLRRCREILDELRHEIKKGHPFEPGAPGEERILDRLEETINAARDLGLTRVVNATGTILHTNLGRALLPRAAIEAVCRAGTSAVNLEYDLDLGERGRREQVIEELLVDLTGAEAATVVNNNAAAVLLALNTLASGKEVIVSRGELIEIGGAFRMPDIMARAGTTMIEVGTTNRTHAKDYRSALSAGTGVILKVHTSNYRIQGFTAEVGTAELASSRAKRGFRCSTIWDRAR